MDVVAYVLSKKYTDDVVSKLSGVGKDGVTFFPSVSDGVLSWTNDGGLENPEPVDISGENGRAATIRINKVTTLPYGSPATVENIGTETDAVLNFGIPQGKDGEGSASNPIEIYIGSIEDSESDLDVLNKIAPSPNKGDIGIIKKNISDEKNSINSYIFKNSWEALNGTYNATDVYFDSDLTITSNIGVQTIGSSGSKTLDTKGKNVKQVFDMIVAEEKNPSITQPSVQINSSDISAKEVGTNVSVSYSCSFNPGSYQYGPSTNVTPIEWNITDTNSNSSNNQNGTLPEFQVGDTTRYSISVEVSYGEGEIPKTNLGNPYEEGRIVSGTKTNTKGYITGYRNSFYGTTDSKDSDVDSTLIRELNKTNKALSNGSSLNISIPVGAIRVILAYPDTLRDVSSITDVNGLGAEIKTSFTKYTTQVFGNNGYSSIAYKVYVLEYANPNNTQNTYKVTI